MKVSVFTQHKDGSLINSEGETVFFGVERFLKEVCNGPNCFLCGSSPDDKTFNNEHIIPKWILKKGKLFNSYITLPNKSEQMYGKYTIRCCEECNSFLGDTLEKEIGKAVNGGIESLNQYVETTEGYYKTFLWLALIYLKTHLKDQTIRFHQDARKGSETIGENLYDWELIHHIHCMIRALKTGVEIDSKCFGSLIILPAHSPDNIVMFDYSDMYPNHTIMLRIDEIAFLAVLNDSGGCLGFLDNHTRNISAPLSVIQLKEMFSHISYLNNSFKNRPEYFTKYDPLNNKFTIDATLPEKPEIYEYDANKFGSILFFNTEQILKDLLDSEMNSSEHLEAIKRGEVSFLFGEDGKQLIGHLALKE